MEALRKYIQGALGQTIELMEADQEEVGKLPFYIKQRFSLKRSRLIGQDLFFLEIQDHDEISIRQIEKQLQVIGDALHKTVVLIMKDVSAITRKRLIEKSINFIVPGKQMYLPALLLDLREVFEKSKPKKEGLLPSAQVILIYRILNRYEKIEELSLKQLARKFKYTATAITKAVDNLKHFGLCKVYGTKEKYIRFHLAIPELWDQASPLLSTPVLKQVYVDALPSVDDLIRSGMSALPEYTDMNVVDQPYYAVEKGTFYDLQKKGKLLHANELEGRYCLEVWKYNPGVLDKEVIKSKTVDPLSLYLSLRNNNDERIEIALEKILKDNIW